MNATTYYPEEVALPCAPLHWASLSAENKVSLNGAVRQYQSEGRLVFTKRVSDTFVGNWCPVEKGHVVLLGAVAPENERLVARLKEQSVRHIRSQAVAAIYALAPRLLTDEKLQDWFMMQVLRLAKNSDLVEVKDAYAAALDIWQTSGGSTQCMRCRKR